MSHSVRISLLSFLAVAVLFGQASGPASGSATTLQTNGVNNSSQAALNLVNGTNCTVTNTSGSTVSFTCTGGAPNPLVVTSNTTLTSSDCGNLVIANPTVTTITLASSPPTSTCLFKVQNYQSGSVTLASNGATIEDYLHPTGSTANRTIAGGSSVVVETDGAGNYLLSYYDLQGPAGPTGPQGPTGPSGGYAGPSVCNVVTGSRVSGTAYQNTTGNPMWITVTAYNSPGSQVSMTAYSDSSTTPTTNVDSSGVYIPSTNNPVGSVHPLVLASNYYKVTISSGILNTWVECH